MNNVTKTYYYLTNRGFASEIIQLINAVSHALISRKPIYVISKTWNAAVSKGWLDYFNNSANLFILTEDTTPKIKLRNFKISKEFLLFIYFTETFKLKGTYSPKKGLTKYFKPIINTFILSIINELKGKSASEIVGSIGITLNKKARKEWNNNVQWGNSERNIYCKLNQNEFGILSELHVAIAQKMFAEINPVLNKKYIDLKKKSFRGHNYASIHIRRGDKLIEEAKPIPTKSYSTALSSMALNLKYVFISSDDYSVIEEFIKQNPNLTVITLTPNHYNGHAQQNFNDQTKNNTKDDVELLLLELMFHIDALHYFGTVTSNITRLIALLRNNSNTTFSLDKLTPNVTLYNNLITFL